MRRFVALASVATLAAVAAAPAQAATPTFGGPNQVAPGVAFGIGVALLNGDAAPDALTTPGAVTGMAPQVALNRGDGTSFIDPADITGAGQVERPAFADLDGDGDTDVVLNSTGGVIVAMGNGVGGFAVSLVGAAVFTTDVAVGDVTNDGRPDIVATRFDNTTTNTDLLVFRREANGTYTTIAQGLLGNAGRGPRSVALADLNGDGFLDAITGDSDGLLWVLPGNGTGNYATRDFFQNATEVNDIIVRRLDGDANLDVVTASSMGGTIRIFKGNGTVGPIGRAHV